MWFFALPGVFHADIDRAKDQQQVGTVDAASRLLLHMHKLVATGRWHATESHPCMQIAAEQGGFQPA